jgi:hypothetical protein
MSMLIGIGAIAFASSPYAAAISDAQRKALDSNVLYFNTEDSTLCTSNTVSTTLPATVPEPYNSLFTAAGGALGTNPQFVAALFLDEHSNAWANPNGPWASSSAGAQGPFQFLPATWDSYKTDGDNNGVLDIQNLADAAYTAANWAVKNGITANTPLGDINQPFANANSMLYKAAAYNWGGGNVEEHTTPTTPVTDSVIPTATQNYVKNTYALISSGFTAGDPSYGNIVNLTNGAGTTTTGGSGTTFAGGCSAGVVAGSVVQTALNLSWSDGKHGLTPKPEYTTALQQYNPTGLTSFQGADCGAFVATVLHASGADPAYPGLGTSNQEQYMIDHPEKYAVVQNVSNTADLEPGDIFIINANGGAGANGHTFIYVGPQPNGATMAEASEGDEMPFQGNVFFSDNRGSYDIYRLKS